MALSPLNKGKKFDLFDLHDHTEYWEYLCNYDIQYGRCDGLMCFTRDMYASIASSIDEWPESLLVYTMKIRKILFDLTDRLYELKEGYGE